MDVAIRPVSHNGPLPVPVPPHDGLAFVEVDEEYGEDANQSRQILIIIWLMKIHFVQDSDLFRSLSRSIWLPKVLLYYRICSRNLS